MCIVGVWEIASLTPMHMFGRTALRALGEDCHVQVGLDRQLPRFAWVVGPTVCSLMWRHRSIRLGRGVLLSECRRHGTQGLAQDLSDGSEVRFSGEQATY